MPHGNRIPNADASAFVDMENTIILYVRVIPNHNGTVLSPDYGVEPYAAVVSDRDIPADDGAWGNKNILSKHRFFKLAHFKFSFHMFCAVSQGFGSSIRIMPIITCFHPASQRDFCNF